MAQRKRRTLVAPDMNLSLDQSEGSVLSDEFLETPDDLDIDVDDIETPDETDSLEFINNGNELEWEGQMMVLDDQYKDGTIFLGQGMRVGIHLRSKSCYLLCPRSESCLRCCLLLAGQSQISSQLLNTAKMKTNP